MSQEGPLTRGGLRHWHECRGTFLVSSFNVSWQKFLTTHKYLQHVQCFQSFPWNLQDKHFYRAPQNKSCDSCFYFINYYKLKWIGFFIFLVAFYKCNRKRRRTEWRAVGHGVDVAWCHHMVSQQISEKISTNHSCKEQFYLKVLKSVKYKVFNLHNKQ